MATILEETMTKINGYVDAYNKALLSKAFEAKDEAKSNIDGAIADYKKQKLDSVLYHLSQESDPMMAAVKMLTYNVPRAKVVKEDGVETGIEIVDSPVRVNLVKVAERCNLSTVWKYKVEKLGLLLSLRAAKELNIPAATLASMTKDYRMNDLARKVEMGETPESNTQIVKMIQTILDEVLPESGKKANSHDAAYMWLGATRLGREVKTIKVCDPKLAHNLLVDVFNRIVTDGVYTVDYRKVKESKAEEAKDDETDDEQTTEESADSTAA